MGPGHTCMANEGSGSEPSVSIPVEDFSDALSEQFDAVERAVEAYREGSMSNVAVVAEPFAGRGSLLDYGEELLDEETVVRHSFTEPASGSLPEFEDADAYLVADCHYLYRREIGGFDLLEQFVERMARSDALFITSWNRYAWSYLAAIMDLDRVFPEVIHVTDFDAEELADVVESIFGPDLPEYVERGSEGRIKSVEWVRYPIELWGDRTVGVPVLKLNPEYVMAWLSRDRAEDTEAVIYEKIRRAAGGNVGVAADLWARSVTDGEIATGYVDELDPTFDLDIEGAMVLRLLVAMETVPRSSLASILEDAPLDSVVQHLLEEGVVEVDTENVMLTPQGLRPAVAELDRRRLVW
jgi:hypothetical protein